MQAEHLFLVLYEQEGLLRRDSVYHDSQQAFSHCRELQQRFPEAQARVQTVTYHPNPYPLLNAEAHFFEL